MKLMILLLLTGCATVPCAEDLSKDLSSCFTQPPRRASTAPLVIHCGSSKVIIYADRGRNKEDICYCVKNPHRRECR